MTKWKTLAAIRDQWQCFLIDDLNLSLLWQQKVSKSMFSPANICAIGSWRSVGLDLA